MLVCKDVITGQDKISLDLESKTLLCKSIEETRTGSILELDIESGVVKTDYLIRGVDALEIGPITQERGMSLITPKLRNFPAASFEQSLTENKFFLSTLTDPLRLWGNILAKGESWLIWTAPPASFVNSGITATEGYRRYDITELMYAAYHRVKLLKHADDFHREPFMRAAKFLLETEGIEDLLNETTPNFENIILKIFSKDGVSYDSCIYRPSPPIIKFKLKPGGKGFTPVIALKNDDSRSPKVLYKILPRPFTGSLEDELNKSDWIAYSNEINNSEYFNSQGTFTYQIFAKTAVNLSPSISVSSQVIANPGRFGNLREGDPLELKDSNEIESPLELAISNSSTLEEYIGNTIR